MTLATQRLETRATTCSRLVSILLGLATLLAAHPSGAQPAHGFRLLPDPQRSVSSERAYFAYEATAGQVIHDALTVRNLREEPLHLSLYAADTTTASHGGIAIATRRGELPQRAGTWVRISEKELTLDPGEERSVPFTVSPPGDLSPGEYAASIVAQRSDEPIGDSQSGPVGIRFVPRFAVTLLVTLPGTSPLRHSLEIMSLRGTTGAGQQAVIARLGNPGNDGLNKAEGKFTVRQPSGTVVREIPVRLGYFLAGDDLDFRIGLEPELDAGEYDVTLSLTHDRGTVELTRRLYLGEVPELPVIRSESAAPEVQGLPAWVLAAIGAGGLGIALLSTLLLVQSRRLARLRATGAP